MNLFHSRHTTEFLGIFSSTAFLVYSWSLVIFFWDIPSFLLRFSTWDILGYAAYQFTFAFLESTIASLFIFVLGLLLPAKFLRNHFRAGGMALILAFAINAIVFKERGELIAWFANTFSIQVFTAAQIVLSTWAVSLVILPIGLVMIAKKGKIEQALNKFVDNLSVLVGLYVILSLLGIIVVIFRNIA